jgi:hypothetical protein
MRRNSAFSSHGHYHMRAQLTDAASQIGHYGIEILAVKLSVRIIEHGPAAHFQQLAGSVEFKAARGRKFIV